MALRENLIIKLLVSSAIGAMVSLAAAQPPAQPPAQPVAQPNPVLQQIVSDLGSDDVILRMDAQRRLSESTTLRLRDVESVLKDGQPLSTEQRLRLINVAYKRFCSEPRAALGVQSGMQDGTQRGVLLSMVMREFPASETLRPGDRILTVDGQSVTDITLMRPVVIAHDPGDEVPVTLIRDGANITVKVKLGRYNDLSRDPRGGVQAMTPDMVEPAWEFRFATYPKPKSEAQPIETGLSAAEWKIAGDPDGEIETDAVDDSRQWGNVRARLDNPEPGAAELVAAGEARGAGMVVHRPGPMAGGNFRVPNADAQILIAPDAQRRDAGGPRVIDRKLELARIRQAQESLRNIIQRNEVQMRSMRGPERQAVAQQNAMLKLQIDELERMAMQPLPQPPVIKP